MGCRVIFMEYKYNDQIRVLNMPITWNADHFFSLVNSKNPFF